MKKILFLFLLCVFTQSYAQIIDQFTYVPNALNANGWTTHSGTAGQILAGGSSLTYTGLPSSMGGKTNLVAGNSEDLNKALSIIPTSDSMYYSMILKINDAALPPNTDMAGQNFFGVGQTAGVTLTVFGGVLRLRKGTAASTYQIAVLNTGAAGLTPVFTGDLSVSDSIFVVVKLKKSALPGSNAQASLWINPPLGTAVSPAPLLTSTLGASAFLTFGSLYIRQAGTSTNGTGNIQLDEIRASHLWTDVAPGGCASSSSLLVSGCGSISVNGTIYTSSGNYTQVLTAANSVGCDSTINITAVVNPIITNSVSVTECGTYTFNGNVLAASGIYVDTLLTSAGCDSIVTLNLTIATSIAYYIDTDGDSFGNSSALPLNTCTPPVGYVTNNTDCNDANPSYNALAVYYSDSDGDGFGDPSTMVSICVPVLGMVTNNLDCDDANASINLSATDIPGNGIDEDCSGSDSTIAPVQLAQYLFTGNACATPFKDVTAQPSGAIFSAYSATTDLTCAAGTDYMNYSGWSASAAIDSLKYYSFTITPNSCQQLNLNQLLFSHRISGSGGTPTVILRSSLDNFASNIFTTTIATPATLINEIVNLPVQFQTIYAPLEFRFYATNVATTGSTYRHDNVSVTGNILLLPTQTYYADMDGDGFGGTVDSISCVPPVGYSTTNTDCDDTNPAFYPGALWFQDLDADGVGSAVSIISCTQPVGFVSSTNDCDDNNAAIQNPTTYYQDADGDSFGGISLVISACTQPIGYVTNGNDCDDNDPTIGLPTTAYYADADNDGYGDQDSSIVSCLAPVGFVANSLDCNDSNPAVNPTAQEICDNLDNNCDGNVDEGVALITWFEDADGDGDGNAASTISDCSQPSGYVGNNVDCDDTDPTPNAGETIFYTDADGDNFGDISTGVSLCVGLPGLISVGGDCNDSDAAINPNAVDASGDGIDQNCDGVDGNLSVLDIETNIGIHPNPGTDVIFIESSEFISLVEFYTTDGKLVFAKSLENNQVSINALKVGTYLVRIHLKDSITVKTFIKN